MNPRSLMPPLGILQIGATLIEQGFDVEVLDAAALGFDNISQYDEETQVFGLSIHEIQKRVHAFSPHFVGISCLFSIVFPVVQDICRAIKQSNSEITTVLGGAHPSYQAKEILQENQTVDYIVQGEGETSFSKLILSLKSGLQVRDIDGLAFRDGLDVVVNPKVEFVTDLDSLPLPAWDLVSLDAYATRCIVPDFFSRKGGRHASILTTRGCPHKCSFCVSTRYWGNRYRKRKAAHVLNEMQELISKHGVRRFSILDDNFFVDRKRAIKILQGIIDNNWNIEWYAPNGFGVWHLDEEILVLMKRSGLSVLCLSLESCSPDIIEKHVHKPIDLEKTRLTIKLIEQHDLNYFVQFIMGFPDETKETVSQTLDYISELNPSFVLMNMASPFPGTALLDKCIESDCFVDGFDFTRLNYTRSLINTRDYTAVELTNYVQRKQVTINLSLMLRKPLGTLRRYSYLMHNPLIIKEFARIHWNRLVGLH
jgi:phosphonoacetaldehyde methylase